MWTISSWRDNVLKVFFPNFIHLRLVNQQDLLLHYYSSVSSKKQLCLALFHMKLALWCLTIFPHKPKSLFNFNQTPPIIYWTQKRTFMKFFFHQCFLQGCSKNLVYESYLPSCSHTLLSGMKFGQYGWMFIFLSSILAFIKNQNQNN